MSNNLMDVLNIELRIRNNYHRPEIYHAVSLLRKKFRKIYAIHLKVSILIKYLPKSNPELNKLLDEDKINRNIVKYRHYR